MWKPNCDSEGTIPTECTEILTNFLDEFGLRATQYLTGLYTNTLGAPPSFIQVSLQQSMVLDPLQQRWYTKNSLPVKPNKEAKCCTNPSTYFHPETSWWMSFGILRNIYWFKKKNKKNLSINTTIGKCNKYLTFDFSRITYRKLKSPETPNVPWVSTLHNLCLEEPLNFFLYVYFRWPCFLHLSW